MMMEGKQTSRVSPMTFLLPTQLTFGVFFSVFLLTRTGLSYLTSDEFGGIIMEIVCDTIK